MPEKMPFLPVTVLLLLCACAPVPDGNDIFLLNDRSAPVIRLEAPSPLEYTADRVEIRGSIQDEPRDAGQPLNIVSFTYYFAGEENRYTVAYNRDGNFLIALHTLYFPQTVTIVLEAGDASGNKGTCTLTLVRKSAAPVVSPAPTATGYGIGAFWFVPTATSVPVDSSFTLEIHMNSGTLRLASYGLTLTYNSILLCPGSGSHYNSISAGPQGFISAVNANTAGSIVVSGFDTSGKGPGANLHILSWHLYALKAGTASIGISIQSATDTSYSTIGTPQGSGGSVVISG